MGRELRVVRGAVAGRVREPRHRDLRDSRPPGPEHLPDSGRGAGNELRARVLPHRSGEHVRSQLRHAGAGGGWPGPARHEPVPVPGWIDLGHGDARGHRGAGVRHRDQRQPDQRSARAWLLGGHQHPYRRHVYRRGSAQRALSGSHVRAGHRSCERGLPGERAGDPAGRHPEHRLRARGGGDDPGPRVLPGRRRVTAGGQRAPARVRFRDRRAPGRREHRRRRQLRL